MAMVMENQQPLAQTQTPVAVVPAPPLPPPPPPPPPPQAYKHRCKVCKKGFVCGRALGGHMRAHGVTDDVFSAEDDALDDDDSGGGAGETSEVGGASAAATKCMYSLRASAGRLRNYRACENCGKEFTSWKSLLDHGRCTHEQDNDNLSTGDTDVDGEDGGDDYTLAAGWSKGKRTRRGKAIVVENDSQIDEQMPCTSREEEDLANCLVMLASSRGGAQSQADVDVHRQPYTSSASTTSKDEQFLVPQPISMLPPTVPHLKLLPPPQVMTSHVSTVPRGLFECKACKKVFTSHQALGGHRASHKKVKGCYAAKLESHHNESPQPSTSAPHDNVKVVVEAIPAAIINTESNGADGNGEGNLMNAVAATAAPEMAIMQVDEAPSSSTAPPFRKKGKVHECSICHRVFSSGQALGGHKRCHWLTTGAGDPTGAAAKYLQPFSITQDPMVMPAVWQPLTLGRTMDQFDLNVPTNIPLSDPATTARPTVEVKDDIRYVLSWAGPSNTSYMYKPATMSGHHGVPEAAAAAEDEADSRSAKRAKIGDLKDMDIAGETSSWLQVGIALSPETNERTAQTEG